MILGSELQFAYTNLYSALREYVLDIKIVEALAELEVEIFKLFPDLSNVSKAINQLRSNIYNNIVDEDVTDALIELEDLVKEHKDVYALLTKFVEVIHDNQEAE